MEIHSGDMVKKDKTVVFTATPDTNFAVDKWTNNGTVIAGETSTTYNHPITADARDSAL